MEKVLGSLRSLESVSWQDSRPLYSSREEDDGSKENQFIVCLVGYWSHGNNEGSSQGNEIKRKRNGHFLRQNLVAKSANLANWAWEVGEEWMNQGSSFGRFANGTVTAGQENITGKSGLGGKTCFGLGRWYLEYLLDMQVEREEFVFLKKMGRTFWTPDIINWKCNTVRRVQDI